MVYLKNPENQMSPIKPLTQTESLPYSLGQFLGLMHFDWAIPQKSYGKQECLCYLVFFFC